MLLVVVVVVEPSQQVDGISQLNLPEHPAGHCGWRVEQNDSILKIFEAQNPCRNWIEERKGDGKM